MAIKNASTNSLRTDVILRHYDRFSLIFQADGAGLWVPQTTQRTMFTHGLDDTVASPWTDQGYTEAGVNGDSSSFTSAFKGGALSDTNQCLILAASVFADRPPRVITADANNTTAGVRLSGGSVVDVQAAVQDRLFAAVMAGANMQLLPTGNQTGCSLYMGLPTLNSVGTGLRNSSIPNYGQDCPAARYTLGDDLIVDPNPNQDSLQPNRIQISFPFNPASVTQLTDSTPVAAGVLLALDLQLVIDFARVVTEADASGVIQKINLAWL
jgi:hypothetical protein